MKVVTVASLKGGAGKSTLAIYLAREFQRQFRTLIIDADPNNNTSDFVLRNLGAEQFGPTLYGLLRGSKEDAVRKPDDGPDIIPCDVSLHKIGAEMNGNPGGLLRLSTALGRMDYERVVIDTPPSLSFEFRAGLYTANTVVVPIAYSRWTMQALEVLLEEIQNVAEFAGQAPHIAVIPFCVSQKEIEWIESMNIPEVFKAYGKIHLIQSAVKRSAAYRTAANARKWLSPLKSEIFQNIVKEIEEIWQQ